MSFADDLVQSMTDALPESIQTEEAAPVPVAKKKGLTISQKLLRESTRKRVSTLAESFLEDDDERKNWKAQNRAEGETMGHQGCPYPGGHDMSKMMESLLQESVHVLRDGQLIKTFADQNAALEFLHQAQDYSWDYAVKNEGWNIVDENGVSLVGKVSLAKKKNESKALLQEMSTAKVYLEDGTDYVTSINGTDQEIQDYFVGHTFTFGTDENEKPLKCVKVEISHDGPMGESRSRLREGEPNPVRICHECGHALAPDGDPFLCPSCAAHTTGRHTDTPNPACPLCNEEHAHASNWNQED